MGINYFFAKPVLGSEIVQLANQVVRGAAN